MVILKNQINLIDSTIVCQKENIFQNQKNNCAIFLQSNNYIIAKYGNEVTYAAGKFINDYRQKILYIKYKGKILVLTAEFKIENNSIIEIYIDKSITSLEIFFSADDEPNAKKIILIDLSHFDSSLIEKTDNMFYACSSLEEIIFENFNISKVTSMANMFDLCSNLKSLNLSSFDTSKVINMEMMFKDCTSLEYLDISNFNTLQTTDFGSIFDDVNSLKYINLYNAQIDNIKDEIEKIINYSTIICQKDYAIKDKTYIKACCDINNDILNCYSNNYISIYYSQNVDYEKGFQYNKNNINGYRESINFIKNGENKIITPSEQLEIKSNSKIEIHLYNSIKSLAHFFNSDDDKTKNIISIDFSHFDSSLITDINSLFSGCSSLEQLDLNNFITKSETLISNIFSGCDNLKYLDISGFNLSSYDFIKNLSNLEFINIYKSKNYNIDAINNINKDLNICQKEKSMQNLKIENKCGYYNINNKEFESTNLIIIYFNKDVEYKSGFINGIESRNNIYFLNNGYKINPNEYLSINKGKKI